ncbi:hypothetical protein KY385_00180 [Candidatus Parcubacteria bacterium]|nr:hypothetical protein [Candidatus Parcubacteria bacterium]
MKKKYLILVLVLVFSSLPGFVSAQDDQTNPVRLEREKRVSERISRFNVKLSDQQKSSYKASCKGAQTKVSAHLENAKRFSQKHDKKFFEIIEKTNKLAERLKAKGQDVEAVQAAVNNAVETNEKLKAAYGDYILALSDTSQMDCQLDPEGFRASIDGAKQKFAELRKFRQEVRKLIKQDLVVALQSILAEN